MTPRAAPAAPAALTAPAADAAMLNATCSCRSVDRASLRRELEREPALAGLAAGLERSHPHLLANAAVFVARPVIARIEAAIAAIERVIGRPGYREAAMARAAPIVRLDHGPRGVFTSYDFHLGTDGPRLIEINTNAGGALLTALLAGAYSGCCAPPAAEPPAVAGEAAQRDIVTMFREEWRLQRHGDGPPSLLIVDDEPQGQYLAPEFELFRRLFERHGIRSAVADAGALEWRDGRLWHAGTAADMLYNRLTDFELAAEVHAPLRAAYEAGAIVLTPHPGTYALYADKRNLVALGDPQVLESWGVAAADRELLAAVVPRTRRVTPGLAAQLWAERRRLFFKPVAGYGARAVYRGDKLTRRVWDEILAGEYLAQDRVEPGERRFEIDGVPTELKFDLRAYTYAGRVQQLVARLYRGQATNFRTPGGGFATVVVVD